MNKFLLALSFALFAGCASEPPQIQNQVADINCSTDLDCATSVGGGTCVLHHCRASNVCATTADCGPNAICATTSVLGNLCTPGGTVPTPQPASTCRLNSHDCPSWEVCGSDLRCHTRKCLTDAQCGVGESCHPLCAVDSTIPAPSTALPGICEPAGVEIQQCPPPPPQQDPLPGSGSGSPSPTT